MADAYKALSLEKLEDLHARATSGLWSWEAVGEKDNSWCLGTEYEGEVVAWIAQSGSCENQVDPALICQMYNQLPALIQELQQLRATRTRVLELEYALRRAVQHIYDLDDHPNDTKVLDLAEDVLATASTESTLAACVGECDLPPSGWWCSRGQGHSGPCAARIK